MIGGTHLGAEVHGVDRHLGGLAGRVISTRRVLEAGGAGHMPSVVADRAGVLEEAQAAAVLDGATLLIRVARTAAGATSREPGEEVSASGSGSSNAAAVSTSTPSVSSMVVFPRGCVLAPATSRAPEYPRRRRRAGARTHGQWELVFALVESTSARVALNGLSCGDLVEQPVPMSTLWFASGALERRRRCPAARRRRSCARLSNCASLIAVQGVEVGEGDELEGVVDRREFPAGTWRSGRRRGGASS